MVFFDTANESDTTFVLVAPGTYKTVVVDTDIKATKSGTGRMAVVLLEILGGDYKGERITARFNVENKSETAQKIGRAEFKRFLTACGITQALKTDADFYKAVANKTLYVEIDHETHDGKTYARPIKYASGPDSAAPSQPQGRPQAAKAETDEIPF